jgi:hypothetical protein
MVQAVAGESALKERKMIKSGGMEALLLQFSSNSPGPVPTNS